MKDRGGEEDDRETKQVINIQKERKKERKRDRERERKRDREREIGRQGIRKDNGDKEYDIEKLTHKYR